MAEYKDIIFEVSDSVATITINRPQVLNAFTPDTLGELSGALSRAAADKSVGVKLPMIFKSMNMNFTMI